MKRRLVVVLAAMLLAASLGACGPATPAPAEETVVPTAEPTAGLAPPAPPAPPAAGPAERSVPQGQVFRLRVGETAGIAGEDVVVTYLQLLSDNRCSPGVRCIVGGNARITVMVASDTDPPATFNLNTDESPRSARYLDNTVELVELGRGNRPVASLRVS